MPTVNMEVLEESRRHQVVKKYEVYPLNASNIEDYQIELTGMASSIKEDARIVQGNSQVDQWAEFKGNVWSKLVNLKAKTPQTILGLSGNPSAIDVDNIDNTFIFGDDYPGNWAQLANMPVTLNQHGFEELNGVLYVVCGATHNGGFSSTKTTYAYDISANTWSQKADAPIASPLQSPVLRAVNGKLYLIGGYTDAGTMTNKTYEYNPSNNTWTEKANMPTAREDMGSAVVDGKIYVFGGLKIDPPNQEPTNIVEVYNPINNTWDSKANMPTARWSGDFACAYNGKIYIVSSSDTFADYPVLHPITTVYEYNPANDTYSQKSDISTGVCYKEVEELDGKLYVMSGSTTHCDTLTNKVQCYDIATDTWTNVGTTPYSAQGAGLAKSGKKIYFSGGKLGTNVYNKLYMCEPATGPSADPDSTKWVKVDPASYISIENNRLVISGGTSVHGQVGISTAKTFTRPFIYETFLRTSDLHTKYIGIKDATAGVSYADFVHMISLQQTDPGTTNAWEDANNRGVIGSYNINTDYWMKIEVFSTGAKWYWSTDEKASWNLLYTSAYSSESPLKIGVSSYNGQLETDNTFIRKYTNNEPIIQNTSELNRALLIKVLGSRL